MTWLNWSLKLHCRLRTFPHLICTHNTQVYCSMNAYFICVIVRVQIWCVYSIACRSNPKRIFEYFICFWKCFYAFVFWVFVHISYFMFFIKNSFRGIFARNSRVSSSRENKIGKNENNKFLDRNFHDCLTSNAYPQKILCFRGIFCE